MCKVILFAGTTEGRCLAEYLDRQQVKIHVCTATEYGESLIQKSDHIEVSGKRLNQSEIEQLIIEKAAFVVVDATHPYATVASANIEEACKNTDVEYIRLLREETNLTQMNQQTNCLIYVNSVREACEYLKHTSGNVFVTTGSKELKEYTQIENYRDRVYARILSSKEAIQSVTALGFEGKNLICMQGPFNEELNYAMLKQTKASFLVTKEAGKNGGFLEKVNAAARLNIKTIVIGRPKESKGYSYLQVIGRLKEKLLLETEKRKIAVVGIGIGTFEGMTIEAMKTVQTADVIFGAPRMLKGIEELQKETVALYKKEDIYEYLRKHNEYRKIAVLVSGDVGFYSAANNFKLIFKEDEVTYLCGISSLSYFCAKLGKPWEDVCLLSNHGKQPNTVDAIRRHSKVFSLMGGKDSVNNLMKDLTAYEFSELYVWVGENLGYENEKITMGTPKEILRNKYEELCVIYIENPSAMEDCDRIEDEEFIRGKVPMTKEEVRSISVSKLELKKESIVYDIGAGTGSVSIQAAKRAYKGYVYAIEKNAEGVLLIEQNTKKFQVSNLKVIKGIAPQAFQGLPVPTHAFIGGSGGRLADIVKLLMKQNPNIHIVINAITLETIAEAISLLKELDGIDYEITQIQTAKGKVVGNYNMMLGQNPVTVITIRGGN